MEENQIVSDRPIREPRQRYTRQAADPQWLVDAVRLHGHLGPWAVLGLRIGQAALEALDCEGYFDVDVRVGGPIAKPPARCIVDGLQFATGATTGKDAIHIELAEGFDIRITNTKTGAAARYRPTQAFFDAIRGMSGHEQVETVARDVAGRPFEELIESS